MVHDFLPYFIMAVHCRIECDGQSWLTSEDKT